MVEAYEKLLQRKRHTSYDAGIDINFLPGSLFDFQGHIVERDIKKGRCANFIDTGLGKTIIELVVAANYLRATNKPVLIITPLAVGQQTVKEAEKFGIDDVAYTKDGKYKSKIVVCNYERLHHLDESDFDCVILDESSILKNFDGAIKNKITAFLKRKKYRFLFTATPSPNDFIELGTSSEALGYLGYTDMLTKFFTNNEDTINPLKIGTKWVLKGHAREAFFNWISTWSISMRRPSDLGFSDAGFILPELITNYHKVENSHLQSGQATIFKKQARTHSEIRQEQRETVKERCEKAIELSHTYETSVYWCNLNDEGDLLAELDKSAYQISGSMDIDKKEEILTAFSAGEIKKLITKAKMTAFGLNWQHCNHTVYFPSFSYEQWYQAIRRFWRFGQKNNVTADMVISEGQQRILDSLFLKQIKADELFSKLNSSLNHDYLVSKKEFDKQIQLPNFLQW